MDMPVLQYGRGSLASLNTHRNEGLEIVYVSRGHLLWHTEGHVEPLSPRSIFYTLPDQEHGSAEEFEPGHEWYFVILRPPPGRAGVLPSTLDFSMAERRAIERVLGESDRHGFRATPRMGTLLPGLVEELEKPGLFHETQVKSLCRAVVVELARCIAHGQGVKEPNVRSGTENRLRALVRRIAAEPQEAWNLERMARECRLGRTQFAKLFVEQTGDSPVRFVNRMRVRRACALLRGTVLPITTIAVECGFETSQYFARVFKSFTGGVDARSYRASRVPVARAAAGDRRRSAPPLRG